jgi:hypothetical protein
MEDVGIFYRHFLYFTNGHLVYFVVIWCKFSSFGMFYQEKSGNPEV